MNKAKQKQRSLAQALSFLLGNANIHGFFTGTIYQGPLKRICLPGLNCYSCPGALGACPIGSLQNGLADPFLRIPFYVLGFLILTGTLFGRFVCGWLCPFGWFQELLYKIPRPGARKKWKPDALSRHRWLKNGKTIVLFFLVAWPVLSRYRSGYGIPAFCSYLCPSGTLMAGIPLLLKNQALRDRIGWLFGWKAFILLLIVVLSILIERPFCRYLCPLGALYGFFNRFSLYRVEIDDTLCTRCGICTQHCPMSVPIPFDGNGTECIRCGQCASVCPQGAIHCGFNKKKKYKETGL